MPDRFTDSSLMPFGKHKNEQLGNIPASYLIWLYENTQVKMQHPKLWDYIHRGLHWLKDEAKNSR